MDWYSHLFHNFSQFVVIHTVKSFGIVNKAEVEVFLELSCFFDDPTNVGNLISGFSAFSKSSLNFWNFTVYMLLKPHLQNFEHYLLEKVGLKLNIQKTKIMASGPITSWEIDGETVETVSDFIFGGSKTTADGDCSHEIKRHLLLGRKVMTNLDSILKSRDITLPAKVCLKLSAEELMLLKCSVGEDS